MIYTELTKKAMIIAFSAHKEQIDKSGMPYIYHPIHLAEQFDTEDEIIVALLHDVIEDTIITLEELSIQGFSKQTIGALALLTHDDGIEYMDYIANIKSNSLATKVKLADLRHNSDATRLGGIDSRGLERIKKYEEAYAVLSN
ncbi:MAG: GTP pyrophosphokinase [Eubacteriaceae bacterium]|nr:GTP pyrophosphokinase [Eubacteriaceae bacterium]